jgi:oxaloacetate decarboxylase gamma subunit
MPGLPAQEWSLMNGVWLSLTGMLIVFCALVLVSLFIAWLPRGLAWINEIFPEAPDHHHHPPQSRTPGDGIDEELVVAIAAVLDARRRR